MKITELRIGSIIEYCGEPYFIVGLSFDGKMQIVNSNTINAPSIQVSQPEIKPSKITADFLQIVGFTKHKKDAKFGEVYFFKHIGFCTLYISGLKMWDVYTDYNPLNLENKSFNCITSNRGLGGIHELQNLYLELTRTELKVI